MKVLPYGETALYVDLELDDASRRSRTHAVARALSARMPGADIVVGAGTLAIAGISGWDDVEPLVREAMAAPIAAANQVRTHEVRVVYDGPDLAEVAARSAMSVADVIDLHAARTYEVELIGFLPGFAYLGGLDDRLVIARRSAPRPRVAGGSVGIAGPYTAIYPSTSPGGWNLIGRALDVRPFDPSRDPPALFQPGDRVRFVPSSEST